MTSHAALSDAPLPEALRFICHGTRLAASGWLLMALAQVISMWRDPKTVTQVYGRVAGEALPQMSDVQFIASFALVLMVWTAGALIVWSIWKLFGRFLSGRIFDASSLAYLKALGWSAVAAVLIDLVSRPLMMAIVSGGRKAGVWSDPNDLLHVAMALLLLIIAEVFARGTALAEDNRQIV